MSFISSFEQRAKALGFAVLLVYILDKRIGKELIFKPFPDEFL